MQFKEVMTEGFEEKIKASKISASDKRGLVGWYDDYKQMMKFGNKKGAEETKKNIIKRAKKAGLSSSEANALFAK